ALIEHCFLGGDSNSQNATVLVSLNRAQTCTIRNCDMEYAEVAIRGIAGVSLVLPGVPPKKRWFSNAIQVQNNVFRNLSKAAIKNAGEAWLIEGNTFQQLCNGGAGAYTHDVDTPDAHRASSVLSQEDVGHQIQDIDTTDANFGTGATGVAFINNWFGDSGK